MTRALVVDDEAPIRRAMAANLRARGYDVDLAESDLTPLDPKEVVAAVGGRGTAAEGSGTAEMTDATREATQRVWWYLLFAAALFLSSLLSAATGELKRLT